MIPSGAESAYTRLGMPAGLPFWLVAAATMAAAWSVRGDTRRAWLVLTMSLLVSTWLLMTLFR